MPTGSGIPWHVRFRAKLLRHVWPDGWRRVWIRYWESQGISEETQMQWATEADERERSANRSANPS
jgi:hypothetical protein